MWRIHCTNPCEWVGNVLEQAREYKPVIWITVGTTVRAAVKENESTPSDQSDIAVE